MMRLALLFLCDICLLASLAAAGEDAPDAASQKADLVKSIEGLWDVTWERFYLPRTHLFYDYLTS